MKIIYVPRSDAQTVSGGDIISARLIGNALCLLGINIEIAPIEELNTIKGADAVFLTQIYQINTAEKAAGWAKQRNIPLFISPLFEEGLRLGYRLAAQGRGNWHRLSRAVGRRSAEKLFMARESARRSRQDVWRRQRALLQQARLLPNTHYELRHLCDWFRLADPRAVVVPLGIDPDAFNLEAGGCVDALPEKIRPWRGHYLLQVGLISARKNQLGFLKAMRDSPQPIVILGRPSPYETDYVAEVRRLARERGNVAFLEHVDLRTLAALYGQAAAHILPSWSERPGLVSLEAAACGCRVVTSAAAPVWEYLGDDVGVCEPGDGASIRRAVQNVPSQPSGSALSQKVLNNYTWDHTARGFKASIESAIGSSH